MVAWMSARIPGSDINSGIRASCKILFMFLAMLLANHQALAAVTAQVDRYDIGVDETINLSIAVNGNDSGEPNIEPLRQDFEILSRSHSSSYSLINGSMSKQSTWVLTLRPLHAGTLHIPALQVGGKHTRPIMIQVRKAAVRQSPAGYPAGAVWLDMAIEPTSVRVQQQAIITLRVYQSVRLNQAQLSEPTSDHAIIERLGKDKNYQESRNGRMWNVTERRYAIFPQQHGLIHIAPVQLDGNVIVRNSGSALQFPGFASPFPGFGSQLLQSTRPVRVRSNAARLSVSAIPSNWKGREWLPAKHIRIQENWPVGTARVGIPITRTLTLRADGLSSSQLPELSTVLPDGLKGYPDQPVLKDDPRDDGMHGSRQQKIAIMPTRAGTYTLPEIDIPWWNTGTGKQETAILPARTFNVVAAPGSSTMTSIPDASQASSKHLTSPKPATKRMANAIPAHQASPWKLLALFFLAGWLMTIVWSWRRLRHSQRRHKPAPATDMDTATARKKISIACKQHDAKACEQALLQFARLRWVGKDVSNLAAFASHCHQPLVQEIKALELYLYAKKEGVSWQGDKMLQAFEQTDFSSSEQTMPQNKQALPSLYPDHS